MKRIKIKSAPTITCPVTKEQRLVSECAECDGYIGVTKQGKSVKCKADEF